ncbi:20S proteasome subunit [Russula vinacea]|nr:20S proteasome subunit [Russula vinacea]
MATADGGAYSYSLTVFSPSGKLVQIEHALAAVSQGTTSLGIKASNGIVIATEKKSSSILIDDSMIEKVAVICPNIGIVYSGMGPDFRILVTKARKSAQAYWKITENTHPHAGVRPYGVSLLVAGFDSNRGPTLYQVDPSGSFWAWKASAIGKNMTNAKTFLEKRYNDDISLEDAIHTALLTLKEGFEGQMTEKTIEIGVVTVPTIAELEEGKIGGTTGRVKPTFRKLTEEEVRDYLAL